MELDNKSRVNTHRAVKSYVLLQRYVDLFLNNDPKKPKGLRLIVTYDPMQLNGCNWKITVRGAAGASPDVLSCLSDIEKTMRLLYSLFDLEKTVEHKYIKWSAKLSHPSYTVESKDEARIRAFPLSPHAFNSNS